MQKLEGVVMPIPNDGVKISYLIGNDSIVDSVNATNSLGIFSENVICFLSELSDRLLKRNDIRNYPDVVSYAFWIRKKNLYRIRDRYNDQIINRLGRGVVFHIAPSNIPVQFAISLTMGLLAGNVNIVRVSDKDSLELGVICEEIDNLLQGEYSLLRCYIVIVRYGHNNEITQFFSSLCDARMIWGGDRTIQSIRSIPCKPRTLDLCFADRTSLAIIDSDTIMGAKNISAVAKDFYADTYYVDQNACSSPILIVWIGNEVEKAQEIFWNAVNDLLKDYELSPIAGSEKLLRFCVLATEENKVKLSSNGNVLFRVQLDDLGDYISKHKCNMGYFFEYKAINLEEIIPVLGEKCQTVTLYGVDKERVIRLVKDNGVRGVDRIVKIGQALGISTVWDGYDLIACLSRIIE